MNFKKKKLCAFVGTYNKMEHKFIIINEYGEQIKEITTETLVSSIWVTITREGKSSNICIVLKELAF